MKINDNESAERKIYLKDMHQWVPVSKTDYDNYYRDINAYRRRQQEHGRCVCPASKRYLCDMDCGCCRFHKGVDGVVLVVAKLHVTYAIQEFYELFVAFFHRRAQLVAIHVDIVEQAFEVIFAGASLRRTLDVAEHYSVPLFVQTRYSEQGERKWQSSNDGQRSASLR